MAWFSMEVTGMASVAAFPALEPTVFPENPPGVTILKPKKWGYRHSPHGDPADGRIAHFQLED
ncbi:MAG: hypothetical protein U1F70_11190 [Candidatus Competibacteraceae bacterium]